jgi:hypothetical protein
MAESIKPVAQASLPVIIEKAHRQGRLCYY